MIRKEGEPPLRWLKDDVDERLLGLFSDEPDEVSAAIQALLDDKDVDEDLHDVLLETFQQSIDEQSDETQGTAWMALVLGELELAEALGPLLQAISCDEDEVLVLAAVRSLRRMGRPAFAAILERLDDDAEFETASFVAAIQVLEGVQLHDLDDMRGEIEESLVEYLEAARATQSFGEIAKLEAVAIALAHLGVARGRATIERILDLLPGGNSFLQEAIEIMEEQPDGVPCSASASWLDEFNWAFGEMFDDDEDFEPELSVSENDDERVVHIRAPRQNGADGAEDDSE